jgi:hypothetical protein
MKKILLFSIIAVFLACSLTGLAQDQNRTRTIGLEKYRNIIENTVSPRQVTDAAIGGGTLLYSENFDNNGGNFPVGWTSGGNSQNCKWNVDASPATPGYFSSPYSLNYNNGSTYDCGDNWGWVSSPLIAVNKKPFEVSFQFNNLNECGYSTYCYWDETFVLIYDEIGNLLDNAYVGGVGLPGWGLKSFVFANPGKLQNIRLEFYFDTFDFIANSYYGPFIDNLEVRTAPEIPISGWALAIGIVLIATFTLLRYRKVV